MPSRSSNHSKANVNAKKSDIITKVNGKVQVDLARNWEDAMHQVCYDLKIPRVTNRKSIKKMHAKIDDMYSRIEDMYRTSPPSRIDYVRGGIVMLLCQMFMDSVLRDKLFEKGVLDLILPLFDSHRTRQLAALALTALCLHGSFKVRRAVAEKTNHIARFIRNSLDDYKLAYFGISTITLCMKSILEEHTRSGTKPEMAIFQMFKGIIDILPLLKAVVESVKRQHAEPTGDILYHAVDLLSTIGMFSPDAFKAYPPAVRFLVAGLRSKDWETRGKCLRGLIGVYCRDAQHSPDTMDPRKLQELFKNGVPDRFAEIYDSYEPECDRELVTASECLSEYNTAMVSFCRTYAVDLWALGTKLAELILRSEYSIHEGQLVWVKRDGTFSDSLNEIPAYVPNKWLYEKFTDSLPVCARALRERSLRGDNEKANILDIKSLLLQSCDDEAVCLAERALRRSPNQAFFHYAVSQTSDHDRGLLAAKKGLECPNLTPSLKWLLLERLVHHAGFGGAEFFMRNPPPTKAESKGAIASLECAYANAKNFIMTGPPDSRLMKPVGYWLVLLTMVMEEKIGRDLKDFEDPFEMIGVSTEFWEMIDVPAKESELYLAQAAALKHYDAAQAEFSYVFEVPHQLSEADAFPIPTPTDSELPDDMVAWFEGMSLGDQAADSIEPSAGSLVKNKQDHPEGVHFNVVLYPCSWCHNPSAALKKCTGCAKVRYCGKDCQRSHWSSHKPHCKS